MISRKIKRVSISIPTLEGAGVHLHRAFGNSDVPLFDPFLLFDDFRSNTPEHYTKGFPWHPQRGIETITYMLKGDVELVGLHRPGTNGNSLLLFFYRYAPH